MTGYDGFMTGSYFFRFAIFSLIFIIYMTSMTGMVGLYVYIRK